MSNQHAKVQNGQRSVSKILADLKNFSSPEDGANADRDIQKRDGIYHALLDAAARSSAENLEVGRALLSRSGDVRPSVLFRMRKMLSKETFTKLGKEASQAELIFLKKFASKKPKLVLKPKKKEWTVDESIARFQSAYGESRERHQDGALHGLLRFIDGSDKITDDVVRATVFLCCEAQPIRPGVLEKMRGVLDVRDLADARSVHGSLNQIVAEAFGTIAEATPDEFKAGGWNVTQNGRQLVITKPGKSFTRCLPKGQKIAA